jgi:hypothetical protein
LFGAELRLFLLAYVTLSALSDACGYDAA